MEFTIPESCGNSPRMQIVAEIARAWGEGDQAHLEQWLLPGAEWHVHPTEPEAEFQRLVLDNVVTHGRLGSCDGVAVGADGSAVRFAHFMVFASTAKTAKIRSITTYVVSTGKDLDGAGND
ncbi:hypothetical protein ACHABX_07490 [Nesterenkonia halotolerans]|uniref:hypothetical protein n=1 Tax=Nesterenkonia halotolerans TaxID=225325 RepID=UPI003EE6FDBB